jgi:hypothetical protein
MPATPEEMKHLVDEFESGHSPVARALADLLVRGKGILQEHRQIDKSMNDAFEELVLRLSQDHGVSRQMLNDTVAALERVRITVDHLDQLP